MVDEQSTVVMLDFGIVGEIDERTRAAPAGRAARAARDP